MLLNWSVPDSGVQACSECSSPEPDPNTHFLSGNHTLVCTVSGAVFAFGSNNHGQLGLGDNEDRDLPTQVPTEVMWIRGENADGIS